MLGENDSGDGKGVADPGWARFLAETEETRRMLVRHGANIEIQGEEMTISFHPKGFWARLGARLVVHAATGLAPVPLSLRGRGALRIMLGVAEAVLPARAFQEDVLDHYELALQRTRRGQAPWLVTLWFGFQLAWIVYYALRHPPKSESHRPAKDR